MIYYLAAKYAYRTRAQMVAHHITKAGHQVCATWLIDLHDGTSQEAQASYAALDLRDIEQADTLVLLQFPCADPEPSTGRHIEYGYALAKGKAIILVGPRTSVFHWLPFVQHFSTLDAFLDSLAYVGQL
jgi:nucleoside 2-deoxyribosyltransferase